MVSVKKQPKTKIDFTTGQMFGKIFAFTLPLMATSILQSMYSMADKIVVGKFSGDQLALAAVGSSTALANFIVNLLIGITAGVAVIVARSYGAKDNETVSKTTHTAITFSAIGGVIIMILGILIARPMLSLMGTKEELLPSAVTYISIFFAGTPASAVYNFSASILRSSGDSKTPLRILSLTGLLNVLLNLFFVLVFGMSSDGVALATIMSQYVSAVSVLVVLTKRKSEAYALKFNQLGIDRKILSEMMYIGIPSALQSSMFTISNILLTGAANSLLTVDITAKSISDSMTNMVNTAMVSYSHASVTAVAQNYGAKKPRRIKQAMLYCIAQAFIISVVLATVIIIFRNPLINMFIDASDPDKLLVIDRCKKLLTLLVGSYFLAGILNSLSGALRGLGYSILTSVVSIGGICGLRILWIYTAFQAPTFHTIHGLYASYPITWATTSLVLLIAFVIIYKRLLKKEKFSV